MPDRKLIGTKVVFKKKDEVDGTIRFKTRIVTLGYMQIPGVDYMRHIHQDCTCTDFVLLRLTWVEGAEYGR